MTLRHLFVGLALVLSLSLCLITVTLVVVKYRRERRERRIAALTTTLRPVILAAMDDPVHAAVAASGEETAVIEQIVISLLTKTRGADREALARFLEREGSLDRAMVGLGARRASQRQRCVELLGAAGHEPAVPGLTERLHDRDAAVRAAAARALGRIGDPEAVEALLASATRRLVPSNVASMAVLRIGPTGAAPLLSVVERGDVQARSLAAELVGVLGDPTAVPLLSALVEDDDPSTIAAVNALGRIGHPAAVPLLVDRLDGELAQDPGLADEELAVALARALGRIGDRRAIDVLTRSLARTRRLSIAAAEALAPLGPRRSRASIDARREGQPASLAAEAGLSSADLLREVQR